MIVFIFLVLLLMVSLLFVLALTLFFHGSSFANVIGVPVLSLSTDTVSAASVGHNVSAYVVNTAGSVIADLFFSAP